MEFKILMFRGRMVDVDRLLMGIYECEKPHLFSKSTTINSLTEDAKSMEIVGMKFKNYIDNLRKCRLVDVTLIIKQ